MIASRAAGHPVWCSTEECHVTDVGIRVHEQAPVRWEDTAAGVAVESRLFAPADEPCVYVALSLRDLRVTLSRFDGFLPVEVARRLRDQLTAHIDAAAGGDTR